MAVDLIPPVEGDSMGPLVDILTSGFAERGLLGLLFMGACVMYLRKEAEIKEVRAAFEKKLAEKDAALLQLQQHRLEDMKPMLETLQYVRLTMDSFKGMFDAALSSTSRKRT